MASQFFDVSLSELIGGYIELEKARNAVDTQKVIEAPTTQEQALHSPDYVSGSEAIEGGNAEVPDSGTGTTTTADYWSRIPKPLLYGSIGVLGFALLMKAIK